MVYQLLKKSILLINATFTVAMIKWPHMDDQHTKDQEADVADEHAQTAEKSAGEAHEAAADAHEVKADEEKAASTPVA